MDELHRIDKLKLERDFSKNIASLKLEKEEIESQ